MEKKKTLPKKIASGGRTGKPENLIKGGKRWSMEKKIIGHHITHFDGEKGFNVTPEVFYFLINCYS